MYAVQCEAIGVIGGNTVAITMHGPFTNKLEAEVWMSNQTAVSDDGRNTFHYEAYTLSSPHTLSGQTGGTPS